MSFRLVRNSVTLDDLERRNSHIRILISPNSVAFGADYVKVVVDTPVLTEFPGIADPQIPGGNSREFLKFWRELRGIYRSFVFFSIFIVDYDILVFNLTHCIMCTTHDMHIPSFEQNLE